MLLSEFIVCSDEGLNLSKGGFILTLEKFQFLYLVGYVTDGIVDFSIMRLSRSKVFLHLLAIYILLRRHLTLFLFRFYCSTITNTNNMFKHLS
jgi:hypothetical protein